MSTPNPTPTAPKAEFPTPRKAAMYSLLFGPGAGQFLVGRKLRGTLFVSIFLVSLLQMVYELTKVMLKHWAVLSQQVNQETVQSFIREALTTDAGPLANLVVILWIISIVDAWVMAYALGKGRNTEYGIQNTEGEKEERGMRDEEESGKGCLDTDCGCQDGTAELDSSPESVEDNSAKS